MKRMLMVFLVTLFISSCISTNESTIPSLNFENPLTYVIEHKIVSVIPVYSVFYTETTQYVIKQKPDISTPHYVVLAADGKSEILTITKHTNLSSSFYEIKKSNIILAVVSNDPDLPGRYSLISNESEYNLVRYDKKQANVIRTIYFTISDKEKEIARVEKELLFLKDITRIIIDNTQGIDEEVLIATAFICRLFLQDEGLIYRQ